MARRRSRQQVHTTQEILGTRRLSDWVRMCIEEEFGELAATLIYGRYSTDEQNPRSLDGQFAIGEQFLRELEIPNLSIDRIGDEGISGKVFHRPGIDEVWKGIKERRWKYAAFEDASRAYRDETFGMLLVKAALDSGMRLFFINDRIDTAEPGWQQRLTNAFQHHARNNDYLSDRVKRAQEDLFRLGAAIGPLRPAYKRRPTYPATDREPAAGPFFDEIDQDWAPCILEAFERLARLEKPKYVAAWLTAMGVPKVSNALNDEWRDYNVISMARIKDYIGIQEFRKEIEEPIHLEGTGRSVPNDPEQILTRQMPHLRIVPDITWEAANRAIDERDRSKNRKRGLEHPLHGIPRAVRGPLSQVFYCGRCGHRMVKAGRTGNAYRCARATDGCWNRATSLIALTDERIRDAVCARFEDIGEELLTYWTSINQLLGDPDQYTRRIAELTDRIAECNRGCANLTQVIEQGAAPQHIKSRIQDLELRVAQMQSEVRRLEDLRRNRESLTVEAMRNRIDELLERIRPMDRDAAPALQQLVRRIEAVPCQQFAGDLVVLRARIHFDLRQFLSLQLAWALEQLGQEPLHDLGVLPVVSVDLFEMPLHARHGIEAANRRQLGRSLSVVGEEFGCTAQSAKRVAAYGRQLKAAGITDPYIELHEPPANASRWRPKGRNGDAA